MRVNIYAEEQTPHFETIETTADTGARFVGIRFFLKSARELHSTPDDDDSSAVTFWVKSGKAGFQDGDCDALAQLFERAAARLYNYPKGEKG